MRSLLGSFIIELVHRRADGEMNQNLPWVCVRYGKWGTQPAIP